MNYDGTGNSHLVVAPTTTNRVSVMHSGSRSQCNTYIRRRSRQGQPTHFCYIVTNSVLAVDRWKKQVGL